MKSTDTAGVRHVVRGGFLSVFYVPEPSILYRLRSRSGWIIWAETRRKQKRHWGTQTGATHEKKSGDNPKIRYFSSAKLDVSRYSHDGLLSLKPNIINVMEICSQTQQKPHNSTSITKLLANSCPLPRRNRIYYKINVNKFIFFRAYGRKAVRVQDIGFAFARNGTHGHGSKVFISFSHCWHMAFLAHWRPPNYRMKRVTWYICALTSSDPILSRVPCIRKIFALFTIRISENAYRYILPWWKTKFSRARMYEIEAIPPTSRP